jgi:protein-L-isoaspartate O-methyltransferase
MTKLDFIGTGYNANMLSFAKGNKLGAIRHLKNLQETAQKLFKEREGIKDLKKDASEEEIKTAIDEFNAEEYEAGVAVIPAEWFDDVSNDAVELTPEGGNSFNMIPFVHLDFLIKKGVVK